MTVCEDPLVTYKKVAFMSVSPCKKEMYWPTNYFVPIIAFIVNWSLWQSTDLKTFILDNRFYGALIPYH